MLFRLLIIGPFLLLLADVDDDGGWHTRSTDIIDMAANGPCNIERHSASDLSQSEFEYRFAYSEPVIITGVDNRRFRQLCSKVHLIDEWGQKPVNLNSANTYSYRRVPMKLAEYIDNYLRPQNIRTAGNDTLYLFGDIDQSLWQPLLDEYVRPRWTVPGHSQALSFGIAGAGTGVPFHFHGPGFAEVIYGRKRWFLYPFDRRPQFDPDQTTLAWYLNEYPKLATDDRPFECQLQPGELIYFPDRWWHATLNIETSIFISTFLSP